ncbi:hypothetical protein SAMN05216548_11441 [Faunimonas pinastri]|uniref:Uncharacterized protein n=1 Tax=Faunimonas pinastri TaxID=1855383 RepID=A0A1H9MTZ1_9HYPH|nr:hypothetical protein [Faunimonas pinastri]SER26949.1 hypothetical protein SAMN05216548_11441 [Faunimonas pinastri]
MIDLQRLLKRLKDEQRRLVLAMAKIDALPSHTDVKKVAELENAILAVSAVIEEQKSGS